MDLTPYSETIQRQLLTAAEAAGDDAKALAERLVAPLDAAIRLAIQEALAVAAEEITCELAPGSVELRVRGRELEFAVTAPPVDSADEDEDDPDLRHTGWRHRTRGSADEAAADGDDGGMLRINLRLPDHLKTRIEQVAGSAGVSVNSWLVRAAATALERVESGRRQERHAPGGPNRYTGWAR
jgi:hypothetical protein